MKKETLDILDKLGKEPGFKVPENYFEEFNKQMFSSLPEVEITDVEKPATLWVRVRPFIYMAAMFVGVFLMITMFKMTSTSSIDQRKAEAEINAVMDNPTDRTNDPSILNYKDSVNNNLQEKAK